MTFNRVFKGYDPQQVDKYIQENAAKENSLHAAQKQRIDELADENAELRKQVEKYKQDEKAISQSLIDSQRLAEKLKNDAEQFSELTLLRAKIFYSAWHAYSQTLVASLSDEEVRQFNELKRKMEKIINAYDGGDIADFAERATTKANDMESPATTNPIDKVEAAAATQAAETADEGIGEEPSIDLSELMKPSESLSDICKDLGLGVKIKK